jgi:hypothetical protein
MYITAQPTCYLVKFTFPNILGSFFSLATLGDCSFATIQEGLDPPDDSVIDALITRIGLITFERPDGTCYWYEDGQYPEDQIQYYFNLLGSDWQMGRIFAAMSACGGWLYFFYTITLCCSAQVRAVRYFNCFILSIVITLFQCLTFLVLESEFCQDQLCKFDRSAGFCIGASACYFIAGLLFLFMSDFPGKYAADQANAGADEEMGVVAVKTEPGPVEEEEVEIPAAKEEEVATEDTEAPVEEEVVVEEEDPAQQKTAVAAAAVAGGGTAAAAKQQSRGSELHEDAAAAPAQQKTASAAPAPVAGGGTAAAVQSGGSEQQDAAEESAPAEEEVFEEEVYEEEVVDDELMEEEVVEDEENADDSTPKQGSHRPFDEAKT